ncbi:MAG: hypothetical protein IJ455_04860 [Agathobacter sp.]|nr:hypothetical protein [Agathobacter sp.]
MYRQCTTEKTATQQKIFQDALLDALQDHMYHEITIIDLCNQTGLSRNIFYRLFECKDDVLHAIIDHCYLACSKEICLDNAKDNLFAFFTFWKKQKTLLRVLDKNHLDDLLVTRSILLCYRLDFNMPKFIDSNWSSFDDEILVFYITGFIGLLLNWYRSDFARSEQEMTDIAYQILGQPPILIHGSSQTL